MKYLLDTDIIIEHLKGKKRIESSLIEKGSAISIIGQAELYYGAYKSKKSKQSLRKIREMFEDLNIRVVGLTKKVVDIYAQLKVKLESKGQKLDEFDLLIAATALSLNLILVTKNKKHFERIAKLKLL